MTSFLSWIENSALSIWMADSMWGYPLVLAAHAVGMAIVVGTVLMIDLRVLGYATDISIKSFDRLFKVAWFGVVLNLLSGITLFCADPSTFFYHPVFWIKLGLIFCGAMTIWFLLCALKQDEKNEINQLSKIVAGLSLAFWLCAIVAGRLIAYVELG